MGNSGIEIGKRAEDFEIGALVGHGGDRDVAACDGIGIVGDIAFILIDHHADLLVKIAAAIFEIVST